MATYDDGYMSELDPALLAELVGQKYNPYQGYAIDPVSEQYWDVYGPTPDSLIAQQFGMLTPNREDFSLDAFFAVDPLLRSPLAQALTEAEGNTIGAYDYLQSPDMQDYMRQQIGRTEWDELEGRGYLPMVAASTPEEKDQVALEFYNRGLEDALAGGAPTSQALMQQYDQIAERMGGRPYPGAGQYDMGFAGPGFGGGQGGGGDPLAELAASPQYDGGIDWQATPADTPLGYGVEDVGMGEGEDRLVFEGDQRYAIINGRKYALPDTMAGPTGTSPYYRRQLAEIARLKRQPQQYEERDVRKDGVPNDAGLLDRWAGTRQFRNLEKSTKTPPVKQVGRAASKIGLRGLVVPWSRLFD